MSSSNAQKSAVTKAPLKFVKGDRIRFLEAHEEGTYKVAAGFLGMVGLSYISGKQDVLPGSYEIFGERIHFLNVPEAKIEGA
ncbi:hypothetical protein C0991_001325 [Blastosporella zonata]|nr:hypothetical protein C0991_001325 [Blastosporella zonata]